MTCGENQWVQPTSLTINSGQGGWYVFPNGSGSAATIDQNSGDTPSCPAEIRAMVGGSRHVGFGWQQHGSKAMQRSECPFGQSYREKDEELSSRGCRRHRPFRTGWKVGFISGKQVIKLIRWAGPDLSLEGISELRQKWFHLMINPPALES